MKARQFVAGRLVAAEGPGRRVLDPATLETVGEIAEATPAEILDSQPKIHDWWYPYPDSEFYQ